jgi:hypothetical protein
MNKYNGKKYTVLIVVFTALLFVSACGSPWQGKGALYIFQKGEGKCIDVDSVVFVSSRRTTYKINGTEYITQSAPEYYSDKKC